MANELESLDGIFELPDEVCSDPKLRAAYEIIIARMRREAEGLPITTGMEVMIERYAFNYIVMRQKEKGLLKGFEHSTAQKDFNTFWLSIHQQFYKQVQQLEDKRQSKLLETVRDIILSTLATVEDPKLKTELAEKFADAFDKVHI